MLNRALVSVSVSLLESTDLRSLVCSKKPSSILFSTDCAHVHTKVWMPTFTNIFNSRNLGILWLKKAIGICGQVCNADIRKHK